MLPWSQKIFYFILSHLLYCSLFAIEALHNTPQSDNGMIKARRMPLGFAAKIYVQVGDIDRNGHAATQAGWYYKWYRGLHLLYGLEGQGEYKHRPDWERELSNTWYFDQDFRCVFQEEEHGPLAREQCDSVIGTKAVDVYLPVRDLSSGGSDEDTDSDLNISDGLQMSTFTCPLLLCERWLCFLDCQRFVVYASTIRIMKNAISRNYRIHHDLTRKLQPDWFWWKCTKRSADQCGTFEAKTRKTCRQSSIVVLNSASHSNHVRYWGSREAEKSLNLDQLRRSPSDRGIADIQSHSSERPFDIGYQTFLSLLPSTILKIPILPPLNNDRLRVGEYPKNSRNITIVSIQRLAMPGSPWRKGCRASGAWQDFEQTIVLGSNHETNIGINKSRRMLQGVRHLKQARDPGRYTHTTCRRHVRLSITSLKGRKMRQGRPQRTSRSWKRKKRRLTKKWRCEINWLYVSDPGTCASFRAPAPACHPNRCALPSTRQYRIPRFVSDRPLYLERRGRESSAKRRDVRKHNLERN